MWRWLQRPPRTAAAYWLWVCLSVLIAYAWGSFMVKVAETVYAQGPAFRPYAGLEELGTEPLGAMLAGLVLTLFLEETFRLFPLMVVLVFPANRNSPLLVLSIAVAVSLVFGAVHVSNGLPLWFALSCQGVIGLLYTLLYLKCGGLQGRVAAGLVAAYVAHLAYDLMVILPARYLLG